jgi:hypothetical protein
MRTPKPPSPLIPSPPPAPPPPSVRLSAERTDDWGNSLIQTSDGGYAIAGTTFSFGAGEADVYVVKLDANGNLQWTKTIGGPDDDEGNSLIQTSDGGYAIAGYTKSFGAGEAGDVYVVKLDANGNLQWTKTIGGPKDDGGNSLIQTSDGGYAIAGYTKSFGAGDWDVYVVKLDANGNLQWTKTIGGPNDERASPSFRPPMAATPSPAPPESFGAGEGMSMSSSWMPMVTSNGPKPSADQLRDEGHLPHSDLRWRLRHRRRHQSFGAGERDVYVVKLDANGNLQWTKTIGGPESDWGYSLIQTSDGGYAIAGYTNPSAQEDGMSMSSSWMPMETSNGPKPSAEKMDD